jgi:ribose 5-phosphate isomerase B
MKIALCSDELYPVNEFVANELKKRGHGVVSFGALSSKKDEPWAIVAKDAALSITNGECQEGIFFCWSGTGISMAANKIPGIRAALCTDAQTAKAARIWNHANVLALSNRLTTNDLAKEILEAWFATQWSSQGEAGVSLLNSIDREYRK